MLVAKGEVLNVENVTTKNGKYLQNIGIHHEGEFTKVTKFGEDDGTVKKGDKVEIMVNVGDRGGFMFRKMLNEKPTPGPTGTKMS